MNFLNLNHAFLNFNNLPFPTEKRNEIHQLTSRYVDEGDSNIQMCDPNHSFNSLLYVFEFRSYQIEIRVFHQMTKYKMEIQYSICHETEFDSVNLIKLTKFSKLRRMPEIMVSINISFIYFHSKQSNETLKFQSILFCNTKQLQQPYSLQSSIKWKNSIIQCTIFDLVK